MNISDIIIKKEDKQLINKLKEHGVLIIEDYTSPTTEKKLIEEFNLILNSSSSEWLEEKPYSLGKGILLTKSSGMKKTFPTTFSFFSDTFMQRITDQYFGKGYTANHKIFAAKDVIGASHHANDLHFDVQRTLKFFLYLTDTSEKNGAFKCVPGSHKITEEIRQKHSHQINYKNREFTRNLPCGPEAAISITGKAGSLIIFDTDVFHQAGIVSKSERWVMRGQTEDVSGIKKPSYSLFKKVLNRIRK